MEMRRRHSSNSSIPIFDTKPLRVETNSALKSDQNIFQSSQPTSRLPSFQHKPNRQKLSLTTRKCLSSNVTPISSPIIPRSINNNYPQPTHQFSKEVIESSAKLINDIDVTLSQLSKQYYSDNNNSFETILDTNINDEDITPTSQSNNNCVSHFSNLTQECCDCKMMNKLKLKKTPGPTPTSQEVEKANISYKTMPKQSHIPSPFKDSNSRQKIYQAGESATCRPSKLPFNEGQKHADIAYYTMTQDNVRKSSKSSSRRSKSTTLNSKIQDDTSNSNPTYTEAWVYNSRLPLSHDKQAVATNDLLNYISQASSDTSKYARPDMPVYQSNSNTNLFQKSIFTQHRHNRNDLCLSPKFPPKIPLPSRKIKNNNEDVTNRDSGIFSSSCSKESSADSSSEPKTNNNHIVQMSLPQPPPRISSLVNVSQSAVSRCPTLTNHTCPPPKEQTAQANDTPKQASKSDRRKARELFASVKQRDELKHKPNVDEVKTQCLIEDIQLDNSLHEETLPLAAIKKEVLKVEIAQTPNSDLESGTVEGYCSDMDNLKNSGYFSDNSGYMSEGGLGLYAQKMQQRFREGLLAVQESLQMTTPSKIMTNRVGSFDRDDISSTSSEEIEDYLKELSSRLVSPSKLEDTKKIKEVINPRKNSIPRSHGNESLDLQAQRKNRIYQERLEKYACDVEPAADFDITSSCSMDLLTGKMVSDVSVDEDSLNYKALKMADVGRLSDIKISSNTADYTKYTGRKASVDSSLKSNHIQPSKLRSGACEILEAAGPTPATFEDVNVLKLIDGENNHYRAMSLPGRPRRSTGWQSETTSLSRGEAGFMYPLPPPPQINNNVYYDVPVCRKSANRTSGSSTPSLLNVRLPYATINQGVKNSISTTSLGKRDTDTEEVYDGMGSHLSLLSTSSYRSLNEERQATEIRKLRRELELAQQKVRTLSGQLSNNGTLVAAFEGTLQSMSMRLQKFAASSESKESELNDLKNTIESLKKQAGSSPLHNDGNQSSPKIYSSSSLTSLSSNSTSTEKRSDGSIKKSSWFKTSLGRAFRKKSSKEDGSSESINDISSKDSNGTQNTVQSMTESESLQALRKELEEKDARLTDVQLDALSRSHQLEQLRDLLTKMRYEMSSLKADNSRLQSLMTVSNGAVSSQSLEQSMTNDSNENLDQNASIKSIPKFKDVNIRPKFDFLNGLVKEVEFSQPLMVYMVVKNTNKLYPSHVLLTSDDSSAIPIGRVGISSMTSWSDLENNIRRLLKEYVTAIDPFSNLGINGESIFRYRINADTSISLCNTGGMRPLTSPFAACENITESKIYLELKNYANGNSIDDMVLEFLIPKPILLRYFSLLLEHKRIILSGPSGTGKSYLANKLALNMAGRYNRDPASSILIFNLDHKSTKELRGYMTTLTEQLLKTDPHSELCLSSSTSTLPLVIILDNLHHVSSFSEIFNSFLSIHHTRSPFVIGTMNQSNTMTSNNLQLHHNFRWVLCTNHMEPVKGFLGRYLRRQFLKHQIETKQSLDQLYHVIEWISIVWQHINKFLETYSSADVTIGPRLFLNCPMNVEKSKAWFVDLWNYSLVPYVLDAVRDGLNTHGRKQATWDDPTDWIIRSWPWSDSCNSISTNTSLDTSNLIRLRPEDVGFDSYQLITTTSAHIGPYPVSSHLGVESLNLNSGRHSAILERRSRTTDKSDHSEALMGMFLRMQEKNNRKS